MTQRVILVMALTLLSSTYAARGGDAPVPRQPLGTMIPPPSMNPLAPPLVPSDRVRLLNKGNQRLHVAYRDGDAEWKQIDIDAGQPTDISCSNCTGAFTVAMHNGKEPKEYKVTGGALYLLGWSDQMGVWILTSSK